MAEGKGRFGAPSHSGMRVDSPKLLRLLAGFAGSAVPESRQSFAERLGQWLSVTDAVPLSAVLNAPAPQIAAASDAPGRSSAAAEAKAALGELRTAFAESLANGAAAGRTRASIRMPDPEPPGSDEAAPDFAPYRRYYQARQREMKARIDPLRRQLRDAVSRRSASLRRLAALDAVFEQALAERERSLLATVPGMLARRFERLHEAHRASLAKTGAADDPARWLGPGGWLARFRTEMHAVARAELELRLQPLDGLVAALDNETTG